MNTEEKIAVYASEEKIRTALKLLSEKQLPWDKLYLGRSANSPPPGGEKNWEYATDLLAVFTGFGLFLANSAIDFQQFTGYNNQGWSTRKLGYLSEFELVYCLAVFCTLKNIERERLLCHLKPFLIPVYEDCLKDLRRKADIVAELARIKSTAGRVNAS